VKRSKGFWLLCSALLLSSIADAKVVTLPVEAVNLSDDEAKVVGMLVSAAYARVSGDEVAPPLGPSGPKDLSGQETLEIRAIGLGETQKGGKTLIVQGTRKDAAGATLARTEMTLDGLSELADASDRFAASLYERKPVAETRIPLNVTRNEGRARNKIFSETVWGLRTGLSAVVASQQSFRPIYTLALDWKLEAERYFLEVATGFLLPGPGEATSGYGGFDMERGAGWYLSRRNFTPYLSGGLLSRLVWGASYQSPVNIAPYASAGIMFPRESSTRVYAELRVAQNVTPMTVSNSVTYAQSQAYPTEFGLNVGIGW
jgi:hypothetical protein